MKLRKRQKKRSKEVLFASDSSRTRKTFMSQYREEDLAIRKTILNTAGSAVLGDRLLAYGSAEDNFSRIATLWNAYLDVRKRSRNEALTKVDVAIFNILLKIARIVSTETHFDSWADIAGYAACGAECAGAQKK